jgi:hypothetical protein
MKIPDPSVPKSTTPTTSTGVSKTPPTESVSSAEAKGVSSYEPPPAPSYSTKVAQAIVSRFETLGYSARPPVPPTKEAMLKAAEAATPKEQAQKAQATQTAVKTTSAPGEPAPGRTSGPLEGKHTPTPQELALGLAAKERAVQSMASASEGTAAAKTEGGTQQPAATSAARETATAERGTTTERKEAAETAPRSASTGETPTKASAQTQAAAQRETPTVGASESKVVGQSATPTIGGSETQTAQRATETVGGSQAQTVSPRSESGNQIRNVEEKPAGKDELARSAAGKDEVAAKGTTADAKQTAADEAGAAKTGRTEKDALTERKFSPWQTVAYAMSSAASKLGRGAAMSIASDVVRRMDTFTRIKLVDTVNFLREANLPKALEAWEQVGPQVFATQMSGALHHVMRYAYVDANGNIVSIVEMVMGEVEKDRGAGKGKGAALDQALAGQRENLETMAGVAQALHDRAREVIQRAG